jgi:asparagine synthase (glutamine-hydrolysing)
MCGIAALLDPAGHDRATAARAMADALVHRGPDGEGFAESGPATLVHRRLAIIDLTTGDQPLYSEDRECVVVVNGEIYNHLDVRAELEAAGHVFATRSDSEVIVHGYEEWGVDVVRRLNGMFTFLLWDVRRERLVAARDPFGVKPLYWWSDGRRVAIASEITALLASGWVRAALDPVALQHYLTWRFVPAPRTMFAGIAKLPPATTLVAGGGAVRVDPYRAAPGEPLDDAGEPELERALHDELIRAIQRQTMSDVPYGAFLSGGLDSAAVVAAMAARGNGPVEAFTVGFPGHGDVVDERGAAAAHAREIGCRHHQTAMEQRDFSEEMRRCVTRLEEPCGTASAPALLQLSAFTAQTVKVVLSGQGADEPLGGYERHQAAAAMRLFDALPAALSRPIRGVAEALPRNERAKRAARLVGGEPGLDRLLRIFEIAAPETRARLTPAGADPASAAAERRALAADVAADVGGRDPLEQMLYLDTHLFLPDGLLVYGDKMSMAHSLEQRVPFLDVELMRLVERLPARLRVRRLQRKWLYRRALRGLVPESALARRKHPFATPYDDWLRSSLGEELERAYARPGGPREVLDAAEVGRLVAAHRSGRADHKRILYCLLEFAHWHATFLEG